MFDLLPMQKSNTISKVCVLILRLKMVTQTMFELKFDAICLCWFYFVCSSCRMLLFYKTQVLALWKHETRMGVPSFLDMRKFTTEVKLASKCSLTFGTFFKGPSAKRARVSNTDQENTKGSLRSSSSSGSLNSTSRSNPPRGLKPSTSGSNLRNTAGAGVVRTAKTTATVRPSVKATKPGRKMFLMLSHIV